MAPPQWEPTPVPPIFDHIEPQTPAPSHRLNLRSIMPTSEYPDDQVEHPDEGGGPPLTVDEIYAAIRDRYEDAVLHLAQLRQQRSNLDAAIKQAVTELAAVKRLFPRKSPTKKVSAEP